MKKIVPFKKELFFDNNIAEITSISLEHTLHQDTDYLISGDFIISGDYRVTDISINTESFNFKIPFDINIDERYNMDKVVIDIEDFYYEIVNSNALLINIEVMIDQLEEKNERIKLTDIIEESKDDIDEFLQNTKVEVKDLIEEHKEDIGELIEEHKEDIKEIYQDKKEEVVEIKDDFIDNVKEYITEKKNELVDKVKDKIDDINEYVTYRIYILKEEDNIESVMNKYSVTRDILEEYNNLNDLKTGDKIIIPTYE